MTDRHTRFWILVIAAVVVYGLVVTWPRWLLYLL